MRPIDADALIEVLGQWQKGAEKVRPDDIGLLKFNHGVMGLARAAVAQLPTLTLDDLREKGKWEITDDDFYIGLTICKCSACNEEFVFEDVCDITNLNYNYCPNCGAKMGGGK